MFNRAALQLVWDLKVLESVVSVVYTIKNIKQINNMLTCEKIMTFPTVPPLLYISNYTVMGESPSGSVTTFLSAGILKPIAPYRSSLGRMVTTVVEGDPTSAPPPRMLIETGNVSFPSGIVSSHTHCNCSLFAHLENCLVASKSVEQLAENYNQNYKL